MYSTERFDREIILKDDETTEVKDLEAGGTKITSQIYEMPTDICWGIQVLTDATSGTLTINHSIDGKNFVPYSENTIDLDLTEAVNTIRVDDHCIAPYLQFVIDITAESGSLTAYFMKKQLL